MSGNQQQYPYSCVQDTKCYKRHKGQLTADKHVVAGLTCVLGFGCIISAWLSLMLRGRVINMIS